ncbi:hypothetical protein PSHT_04903, partial [Puccinia striiformis]
PSTPLGCLNSQEEQSSLRRSSRNTTPTHRPGMVAPAGDSRRSFAVPTSATQPPLSSQISQSDRATSQSNPKKRPAPSSVASTVASVLKRKNVQNITRGPSTKTQPKKTAKAGTVDDNVIDLAQDSDEANHKIVKRRRTHKKDDGFDSVLLYFSAPYHNPGDDLTLDPFTYDCLHCRLVVRGARHTNANLVLHRDGSRQQGRNKVGCLKRADAIKAGAKLQPTVAQTLQSSHSKDHTKIDTFFCPTKKFDNLVLNRDLALQSAFHCAQPSSKIYMEKWQAQSAQSLYLDLKDTMISCLHLALVVSAGLKELGMRSAPPPKVRRGILGPFPLDKSLATVAEEEEYNPKPEEPTRVEGGDSDSIEETDDEEEDEEEEDDEFDKHAARKSQSRRAEKSKPGFFKEILFDSHDWRMIKELNDELEPFAIMTKGMEGDGSTGTLVLPKYYILKQSLDHRKNKCNQTDTFYPMFAKMADKLETYLNERSPAKPSLWPPCSTRPVNWPHMNNSFLSTKHKQNKPWWQRKTLLASKKSADVQTTEKDQGKNPPNPRSKIFNLFHLSSNKAENNKLTVYLKGGEVFEMDAEDTRSALIWWKSEFSCERQVKYPIMFSLARDYLACTASSCAAERTFSAAADVCSGNRGKLLPRTIEMCVSSRMWLKNDVPVKGALRQLTTSYKNSPHSKKKTDSRP